MATEKSILDYIRRKERVLFEHVEDNNYSNDSLQEELLKLFIYCERKFNDIKKFDNRFNVRHTVNFWNGVYCAKYGYPIYVNL